MRAITPSNARSSYCAPHTFPVGGDAPGIMRRAGGLLTHVHVAEIFDHTGESAEHCSARSASASGNRERNDHGQ